jgi:hypothetical protein
MNLLQDIITYVRRIVKTPSNAALSDNLIIDYINRFWLLDMDARFQLFDFKTTYRFQTVPGIDQYNMPLYPIQIEPGAQQISYYPVYQGFLGPAWVNGIQVPFFTTQGGFFNIWPNYIQALNNSFFGNGTSGPYPLTTPYFPALAGHVDMAGVIAGNNAVGAQVPADPLVGNAPNAAVPFTSVYPAVYITTQDENNKTLVVTDSGQFMPTPNSAGNMQLGMLIGNVAGGWSATNNVINYTTGQIYVTFGENNTPVPINADIPINIQSYYIQQGIPRAILFYNNVLTIRPPCDVSYLIELDAYLSPAAFLASSQAVPFAYMSEYIARGAARKILSDTGDLEQFQFYELLFREQEMLVWKRSQRQFTSTRTPTIFSEFSSQSPSNNFSGGGN